MKTKTTHRPSQSPRLSKRAVTILRKVQAAILAEPRLYDQEEPHRPAKDCGSPGCICGWIDLFLFPRHAERHRYVGQSGRKPRHDIAAIKLLGGKDAYYRLFVQGQWPIRFDRQLFNARTKRGEAGAASRRIDHFIATGGAE